MKLIIASALLLRIFLLPVPGAAELYQSMGTTDVYFSPKGGATEAIVTVINAAKREILVQAYSFTSVPIAKALIEAKKTGVEIVAVVDKSQKKEKYSEADFLSHSGIPTFIDAAHAIAHNKIIIIDRSTLVTGSFNFSLAAEEKNAENLLILKGNKLLVARYSTNFEQHRAHSILYFARILKR